MFLEHNKLGNEKLVLCTKFDMLKIIYKSLYGKFSFHIDQIIYKKLKK